jgi:protein-S-isoprenylcysteine O-methyltransferase Ste14
MHHLNQANSARSEGVPWVVLQCVLLAAELGSVFLRRRGRSHPASTAAGAVLLAAGAAVGLAGARDLGRNLTPLPEPKPGGELVTTGVYARVRHPL